MKYAVLAALAVMAAAPLCQAANVNNPYGNIDHRNDAGNNTGDSQVERLNEAQLNSNQPRAAWRGQPQGYRQAPMARPHYPAGAYPYQRPASPYPAPGALPPG